MNDKALNTLEYRKIVAMLTAKAISPMGKEMAAGLLPVSDIRDIRLMLQETSEAEAVILKKGGLPLGGIKDIREAMKRVAIGGTLSIEELLGVSDFLYVCRKISSYSKHDVVEERYEILDELFESIGSAAALENELTRCIANDKDLKDDASATLASLRREIRKSNDRIREHLNTIIHSQSKKGMLQDAVITMRGGRYCVPVKQEYRGQFDGMIHDQSSTGATLFMEPMSVVTLNNKIKELMSDEVNEIDKILRRLSAHVGEYQDTLNQNLSMLTRLDFIFSKGELSLDMNATRPVFNENGYINITKARHPLLSKDTVVPIDVYLGDKFNTLLITGPNTGGKTVSLKTIGLLTLMGQAGLHIPARDKSELAVFDEVFADIGDEQSIEQSLSTFSSHMTNIVRILDNVTTNSLVLLDELGAGTDPTEGAALAIALIKYLHDLRIRSVITTHFSELKVFALSTDRVENASCEFDVETLRPTYRLLIGVPGKSNAFAISKKLGLPDYIIESAKNVVSSESVRFEDVITDLEISKKMVAVEKDRAEQYRREAEVLKTDYERQKKKLDDQRDKLINQSKTEARQILEQTRLEAAEIIRDMQKIADGGGSFKEAEKKRQEIRDKMDKMETEQAGMAAHQRNLKPAPKTLKKGDRIYIHSLSQTATVLSVPGSSGDFMAQAGIMKMRVNLAGVSLDETPEKKQVYEPRVVASAKRAKTSSITPEVDLRGLLVEEALAKVDKFIDDAVMSSLDQVRIIHGKGTGALRSAVHSYLDTRRIQSYRLGVFGEGDTGVTVVEL